MRFGVLGPLSVWTDQGEPVTIPGLKVRAVLADLLVHDGVTVSADRLVDDLWRDEPPGNPSGALQVRVSQLRRALEEAEPGGKNLVVSRAPGYLLQVATEAVDAGRFTALVARAQSADGPGERSALLGEALALWRGPALADFADEEWTRAAILRLEEQRLAALEQRAEARLELGEHSLLVGELGDLVARHPLRERLRAVHMRALYRAGRQSEALAGYAELRERLADELGLDPGPELAALHQAILEQDPGLAPPNPNAAVGPRTNLPASLSPLIGRDDGLDEVRSLLETGRLVTLTGSGGVGKTRLALETATHLVDSYADGVWLVELAPLDLRRAADPAPPDRQAGERGVEALAEAVLTALDVRQDTGPSATVDRLAEVLRPRRTLLVLDNCEHVVEQVAKLAERLLRAAPGLRVLATSREPLALVGEVLWNVPPLDVPDGAGLEAVRGSDAARLFVARAAATAPGFALDAGNAGAVAQLCRRLDGIPLALELAATRVRALGVNGVVSRLDNRFRLLTGGHRGTPARQQTLTAVIDWSWELLTEPERTVLRRLAVHADGCTLEAAEEVCADGVGDAELDVLDLLVRLVDKSLVVAVEGAAGVRYRLLESVSEYCLARLSDAGELREVRLAHARYHLALAVQAEPRLYGHDQQEWLRRLDTDSANLRAALDTMSRERDTTGALTLVNALAWYWYLRGRNAEALRSLETALAVEHAPADTAADTAAARAAAWRAGFVLLLGGATGWEATLDAIEDRGVRARAELFIGLVVRDLSISQDLVGRALTTFHTAGDTWGVAAALSRRARDAFVLRDVIALDRDGNESLRLFRQLGDRWGQLQAVEWLGGLAEMSADADEANRLFEEGLRIAEELGLWPDVARRISWLGWVALQSGEYGRAMEHCERAMRLAIGQGYKEGEIMAEMGLAFAARRAGELDLAEKHLNHLLEGVPRDPDGEPLLHVPTTLVELGFLHERRGDVATARDLQLEAIAAAQKVGDPATTALAAEGLASALAASGKHDRAARLLGLAAAAREAGQTPAGIADAAELERVASRAREALGDAAFTAEYEQGGRLKLDDAAGLA
ncbi:BTAD domain-containing putative transcriptional regulator [Nonomuraea sp. NPDC005983]|uniref:BTAD domain-containing putative transcriptional regulator n=1 Tax=Nonomuraea sp. NPDC005983 TaxID=3155595 RepID=UPI0033B970E1